MIYVTHKLASYIVHACELVVHEVLAMAEYFEMCAQIELSCNKKLINFTVMLLIL